MQGVVRLQSLMLPHGGFCPTKCGENVCFSYWGLNKTVGMSFVPSAHRARSAKSRFDEGYPKNRERRNTLAPSKISTLAWAFAKSFAGFSCRSRKRSTCKVVCFFFYLFLSNKEKGNRSPFQRDFCDTFFKSCLYKHKFISRKLAPRRKPLIYSRP